MKAPDGSRRVVMNVLREAAVLHLYDAIERPRVTIHCSANGDARIDLADSGGPVAGADSLPDAPESPE
jgi:hypothetical protein